MTALRITPEMCALYWDALTHAPPFDEWNRPPADEIEFKVFRRPNWYGYYTRHQRSRSGYTIGIGPKVGAVLTLFGTLGHEAIHLHMDRNRMDTRVEHNRAFRMLASEVARVQGFDPMCY